MKILEAKPKYQEIIPAEKYMEYQKKHKKNIKRTYIIPPTFCRIEDFGKIKIIFKTPIYEVFDDRK